MLRLRAGFAGTALIGAIWAAANLTDDGGLLLGVCIAMVGLIGHGAIDWICDDE